MDRPIVYLGQVPRSLDVLTVGQDAMVGLGKLAEAVLGTTTLVAGLACTPTGPASLNVVVGPGQIYEVENLEATSVSGLAPDGHSLLKQGINLDLTTVTLVPPATTGFAVNVLIEATYSDVDTGPIVLTFQNPSVPGQTYQGPGGLGGQSNTVRKGTVALQTKYGVAATAGSQTTPSPDAGFVGVAVVTLAYGQTTITGGNIAPYNANASYIPVTLPGVPAGVQAGQWEFGVAGGSSTAYAVALNPIPAALPTGMEIVVYFGTANTTTTPTLNVNALGAKAIIKQGGGAVAAGDLTGFMPLIYDGTSWRINGLAISDVPVKLASNITLYVATTGSDSNPGTLGSPFLTLQAAINKAYTYAPGLFSVTIQIADGSYVGAATPAWPGPPLIINGNSVTPGNVVVGSGALGITVNTGGTVTIQNLKVQAASGSGVYCTNASVTLGVVYFGACGVAHVYCDPGGSLTFTQNVAIYGSAPIVLNAAGLGQINMKNITCTIVNPITVTDFAVASYCGIIGSQGVTFAGAGNVTGGKYIGSANGVINTGGSGASYFPGTTAGSVGTGAQYI